MSDSIDTKPAAAPRFEVRTSPLKAWNPEAPDEYVNLDAKPLGFGDVLDAINPLQHLPVIGSIYRAVTGATIEPAARVVGGVLFGGLLGAASAVVNSVVEGLSGKDVGEHVIAMMVPGKNAPPPPPSTAAPSADSPPAPGNPAAFHFASFGVSRAQAGSFEKQGLLTTWVATGAPRGTDGPQPVRPLQDPDMRLARLDAPAAVPVQTATAVPSIEESAAVPAGAGLPLAAQPVAAPATGSPEMRPMSLDTYRARAQAVMSPASRSPAVNDTLGLGRRAEAARALAAYSGQASTNALPAALQAQEAYDASGESSQTFFSASMALGLERYRQLQQQRENASKRGI